MVFILSFLPALLWHAENTFRVRMVVIQKHNCGVTKFCWLTTHGTPVPNLISGANRQPLM